MNKENIVHLFVALTMFAMIVLVALNIKLVLAASLLILFNILIKWYKRLAIPIEIEVVTFGVVIFTIVYGFAVGVLFALICSFLGDHFNRGMNINTVIMTLGYVMGAVLTALLPIESVAVMGIFVTLIVNVYLLLAYQFISFNPLSNLSYSISNIIVNVYLFTKLAHVVMSVLI